MPDDLDRIIQNLIGRGVEDRTLEYKGAMAWTGDRPHKLEIIRDIVCMANARGGHVLVAVEEAEQGFTPVGLKASDQASFDQTEMGSLARAHFAPAPVFTVRKKESNGLRYVLIDVSEFDDVPIVCTKDSGSTVRRGAIYMRTDDPACEEIRSSDAMRTLIDRAVTKRGDALLQQIAELIRLSGFDVAGRSISLEPFEPELGIAAEFLADAMPDPPYWQVTLRPLDGPTPLGRPELRSAIGRSKVEMRGWDFPHVDDGVITPFGDGEQSVFSWRWYTEAYRAFRSGVFVWRGRTTEEFTDDGMVRFVSVIFTVTEFLAFASEFADHAYSQRGVALSVEAVGLIDRVLWAEPGYQLSKEHRSTIDRYEATREVSYPELRVSHADIARQLAQEFFELFDWYDSAAEVEYWQRKLVNREL